MSAIVAPILSASARTNYEKWLFVNYALLDDHVNNYHDAYSSSGNPEESALLGNLTGQDVVKYGTPFFWMNVFRKRDCLDRQLQKSKLLEKYLMTAAFDSYFDILDDGTSFDLGTVQLSNVALPRLGIYVPGLSGKILLQRTDSNTITIRVNEKSFAIDKGDIQRAYRIPVFEIEGYNEIKLLCIRDLSLFGEDYINSINPDVDGKELSVMISESLDFINSVNSALSERISLLEKWYVPLFTPNSQTHTSFTNNHLSGVLFLSPATDYFRLGEAIVHEFHHAELNLLMVTEVLFQASGEKYYSPWRNDPRPLGGLLHGVYVFSELIDFYQQAENLPNMKISKNQLRSRRSDLVHKVRIALEQVPFDRLTPLGLKIIECIKIKLYSQNIIEPLPSNIKNHIKTWILTNPKLSLQLPDIYCNDISLQAKL